MIIKSNSKKYILAMSVIIFLVIAIAIVISVMYINNTKKDKPVQEETSVNIYNDSTFAGDSNILFVCNGDDIGDSVFAMIIEFRIYSENINLVLLDMNCVYNKQTYSDCYRYGGIDSLINSVQTVRNCQIDRYIIIDKAGIGKVTELLGSVNLYVSDGFTYDTTDKSYEISAGYNDLESDALYTYLNILNEKSETSELKTAICEIMKNYIAKINPDNSETLFGEICNCVTTNITITDYYTSKSDFNYLLTHNPECNISDDIEE